MRNAPERVELFILLAKLLHYLSSGHSHVGYLNNYTTNPIHQVGKVIYDSIEVQPEPPTQLLAALTFDTLKSDEEETYEESTDKEDLDDSGITSEATEYEGNEEID
jgi:hypothetical protein